MRRTVFCLLCLVLALVAVSMQLRPAPANPLDPSYAPSMDCNAADYPANVALSGPLVKLQRDAGSPATVAGSAPCMTVHATQNEFRSFQVHVQAPGGGYAGLSVTMSALAKSTGPGGNYTVPAPSTSSADIVVYREGYLDITTPTCIDTATCLPTRANPTGFYPDPLIPAIDPYWHQTTAAFPVAVTAGQNQSAWIDVYIPQGAPSGYYLGSVTISDTVAGTIATLPVTYAVWQWPASAGGYMPSTATLKSVELGGQSFAGFCKIAYNATTSNCANFPGAGGNQDLGNEIQYTVLAVQLLDNRLTLSDDNGDYGPQFSSTSTFNTYEGFLESGTAAPNIYGGATIARIMTGSRRGTFTSGNGGANWGTYGTPGSGSSAQTIISNFMNFFGTQGWLGSANGGGLADYMVDEPGNTCSNWTTTITNAGYTRGYSTPNIPILVTSYIQAMTNCSALNAVDIAVVGDTCMDTNTKYACPGQSLVVANYRSSYSTWLAGNCCSGTGPTRQIWRYGACGNTGTCSNHYPAYGDGPPNICGPWPTGTSGCLGDNAGGATYPNWDVDGQPVANEVEEWLAFQNQETGELYYLLDGCFYNTNGCGSEPWNSVYDAGNNGDGDLLYYGTNATNSNGVGKFVNVSTPIWIPSIRLKLMRDGMEDYEYLHLLNSLGGASATAAANAVSSWIKTTTDSNGSRGFCFNVNPLAAAAQTSTHCNYSFTGDLTDARITLGNTMQALTYGAAGLLPPLNLGVSVAKVNADNLGSSQAEK